MHRVVPAFTQEDESCAPIVKSAALQAAPASAKTPGTYSLKGCYADRTNAANAVHTTSPAVAAAKVRYMRDVVLPVPLVQREQLVEVHCPVLGMIQRSREIGGRHRAQHADPPVMDRVEQRERRRNGGRARILEPRPFRLVIGLDRR